MRMAVNSRDWNGYSLVVAVVGLLLMLVRFLAVSLCAVFRAEARTELILARGLRVFFLAVAVSGLLLGMKDLVASIRKNTEGKGLAVVGCVLNLALILADYAVFGALSG